MRQIQTWNGTEWVTTPVERLPLGQSVINVVDVLKPILPLDALTEKERKRFTEGAWTPNETKEKSG